MKTRTVSYRIEATINVDVEVPETDDVEADRDSAYRAVQGIGGTIQGLVAGHTDGEARVTYIEDRAQIGRYGKYAPKVWVFRA